MTDNIFSQRFYGHREAAWHGKGLVNDKEQTAVETYSMMTPYSLEKRQLQCELSIDGEPLAWTNIPHYMIVRGSVPDDSTERAFGIVSEQYQLIEPQQVCEIWDVNANLPIETMGSLGQGEKFFVTADIGKVAVKGDASKSYLFLACPYNPGEAITLYRTEIRVVCQNTWRAAAKGKWEWRGNHNNPDLSKELAIWLEHVVAQAKGQTVEVEQFMNILAGCKLGDKQVAKAVNSIYQPMNFNVNDWPVKLREKKFKEAETQVKAMQRSQDAVMQLFFGKGTPMENKELMGSAYHLFQSVVEFEDYRKSTKDATESIVMGERAANKMRAAEILVEMAGTL